MQQEWLPAVRGQLRPLTHAKYEQVVRSYVAGRDIGAVPLRPLSPGRLNALYRELEEAGLQSQHAGSRTRCCAAASAMRSSGRSRDRALQRCRFEAETAAQSRTVLLPSWTRTVSAGTRR
jgi:hypothetical protein